MKFPGPVFTPPSSVAMRISETIEPKTGSSFDTCRHAMRVPHEFRVLLYLYVNPPRERKELAIPRVTARNFAERSFAR